ncbi:MAG: adenylate/guanylate cyclase domain-containing protein [Syntrophobacterales bacterium]|jgi:class 3 adenylate cyclase
MPSPYLEWIDENKKMRRLDIVDRVFIGRICKGIDDTRRIILKHPAVSRDHVEINLTGTQPIIRDLSKNGTWVNNVRLAAGSTKSLENGDVVRLGDTQIYIRCPYRVDGGRDEEMESTQTLVTPREVIVTNVVADVRGFCSISQMAESYRVYELMKEIIQTFCTIVHDHKGTIKDYNGDEVYAFWEHGSHLCKDQAAAACLTAVEQAKTVNQIRAKLSGVNPAVESLRLGWGITTGKVTMSHYGWRVTDLTLVGDSTNSAFRLSSMANKKLSSEIVVCCQTAELVQGLLPTEDLGLVTLRGRSGQERVYGIGREGNCTESRRPYEPSYVGERVSVSDFPEMIH